MSEENRRPSEYTAALVAWGMLTVVATVILVWPRPVAPREMPLLRSDSGAVSAVLAKEDALIARAPTSEAATNLRALIRTHNTAEGVGHEDPQTAAVRNANLVSLRADVQREAGDDGVEALRAQAIDELESFVASHPNENRRELVGTFPEVMERYGVTLRGSLRAPAFVLRTLFKARWNNVVGLAPVWRLSPVEKQAYFGWLAIGAESASNADRLRGLSEYHTAGGAHANEVEGVLAWRTEEYERAGESFRRALDEQFSIRLRNHEVAANTLAVAP